MKDNKDMKRKGKIKKEMEFCYVHNRSKEIYCFKCKKRDEPMCPICMCNHQNEVHGEQAVHITTIIDDVLIKVSELMKGGVKHQEEITRHNTKAEKLIREKEEIRLQLDERLESLMVFYTQQKAIVAENNAAMLKSHERILKEAQKAEYKINDNLKNPDKVAHRVKEMVDKEDYWAGLAEANRALVEDVVFEDASIKEELTKSEKLLQAYHDQLATLDITPLHNAQYKKLIKDNEDLTQMHEKQLAEKIKLQEDHIQTLSNHTFTN